MSVINVGRQTACFETVDNSHLQLAAEFLIRGAKPRDIQGQAARLAKQFLRQNRGILQDFSINSNISYDGDQVNINLYTSGQVGAFPLLSPTSGCPDYGLVIKPRFGWKGIGPLLAGMGWKVLPEPLPLPLLPQSDRKIPSWVLASTVLFRLQRLLEKMERRFEYTKADLNAPRGQVDWTNYATTKLPQCGFLNVPCRFPDLRDDRDLKAAIHYTLRKQLAGLESQQGADLVVLHLIRICQNLLEKVRDVPSRRPNPTILHSWLYKKLETTAFREGIQAVGWSIDDRGLAGLGDLQGLPWILSMELFFEAWVETVINRIAARIGGIVKSGRQRQTITPLSWSPPYLGSQRYLLPDLVFERDQETIIIDAKYKNHWEELNRGKWFKLEEELRGRHRNDLLQVLAYSTVSISKRVVCCLIYPCRLGTWRSLLKRKRSFHKAFVRAGSRRVELVLTAVPMGVNIEDICRVFEKAISET
ncbi:MAG TPA: hypothetical protein GX687_06195 [Clostridia bacterium]|nr:hypothetical protein [Clostridia bacterium]